MSAQSKVYITPLKRKLYGETANIEKTAIYTHTEDEELVEAVKKI